MMDNLNLRDPKKRFAFGRNWSKFLAHLNEDKILEAEKSLQKKLGVSDLRTKTFLDVGSGSGLFSLAAHRLGAEVFSFDYDPDSVACTEYLKKTYGHSSPTWTVTQGSVLDQAFLQQFEQCDILYSWGVLHHTGNMYQGLEHVSQLVKKGGHLFISIYNDQGIPSVAWKHIKKTYVNLTYCRVLFTVFFGLWLWKYRLAWGLLRYGNPFKYIKEYGTNNRGMSAWYDVVDWVGGYPFEVAKPEQIFDFFTAKGFTLRKLKTCGGNLGCNEFVFTKD